MPLRRLGEAPTIENQFEIPDVMGSPLAILTVISLKNSHARPLTSMKGSESECNKFLIAE